MLNIVFALLLVIPPAAGMIASEQKNDTYPNTRKLLAAMDDERLNDGELAKLFRIGDARIADLIRALDDKDQKIKIRAQVVIRYLGNREGMEALVGRYQSDKESIVRGSIPVPLSDWDYNFIERHYLTDKPLSWHLHEFMYALAIDGSPRATAVLDKLLLQRGKPEGFSAAIIHKAFSGERDVARLTLKNAFFVSPEDRQYTSSRLLAFSWAQDKALVEIYINRGILMEEWHHVVVSKSGDGWKFFSISMVGQS